LLAALDELAGGATSNDFDVYVGTSAGAVLTALLANGARPREIFEAVIRDQSSSPFCFQSRDILGVGSGGPLRMMGQFARATFGTVGRAVGAKQAFVLHRCLRTSRSIIHPASIRPKLSKKRSATDFRRLDTSTSSTNSRGNSS
jgi:predicted acylesterase/phospholipase RssA